MYRIFTVQNIMNMSCTVLWIIFTHKKIICRVKLPTVIHWVGGWVGPWAGLGVSKDKTFISCISELDKNRSLWLATYMSNENIYWDGRVSICNCLQRFWQESCFPLLIIILIILFCILKMLLLRCELPQNITPYDITEWKQFSACLES